MNTDMEFRSAHAADAEAIANLHTQSWQRYYQNDLSRDYLVNTAPAERQKIWRERFSSPKANQHVIAAMHGDLLVGFVCLYLDENSELGSYIDNLHVGTEFQGKGLGKQLLNRALEHCRYNAKANSACLLVNRSNTNAQAFYLRHGATNIQESVWNAPDGSTVPTYWFAWRDLRAF